MHSQDHSCVSMGDTFFYGLLFSFYRLRIAIVSFSKLFFTSMSPNLFLHTPPQNHISQNPPHTPQHPPYHHTHLNTHHKTHFNTHPTTTHTSTPIPAPHTPQHPLYHTQEIFKIIQPVLIGKLIEHYTEKHQDSTQAYMYAGAVCVSITIPIFILHHYFYAMFKIAMNVRVACCDLLYQKVGWCCRGGEESSDDMKLVVGFSLVVYSAIVSSKNFNSFKISKIKKIIIGLII